MKISTKSKPSEPLDELHAFRLSRAQKSELTEILNADTTFEVDGKELTANDILRLKVDEMIALKRQAESQSA